MKKLAALLVLCGISFAAVGGTTMFGVPDCGKWIVNHTESQKGWLLGFLSGLASMDTTKDVLDSLDSADQIYLWTNNYCQANPLSTLNEAGNVLYLELIRKHAKRK
jgi:hypothetical protein